MIYELSFAQLLSAVLGGTLLQYSITIGLFTFSLGLAALVQEKIASSLRALFFLQLATAFFALLGHLYLEALFRAGPLSGIFYLAAYAPVILIGLITGLELPLLLKKTKAASGSILIAWDYFGMFMATVLFPLLLLPYFGNRGATAAAMLVNLSSAALLYLRLGGAKENA